MMQSSMVLFLFFLILSLLIMAVMIHARTQSYLLTFCLLFSAGTLTAIERGNAVLIAFILTLYFTKHYKDENHITAELALLALAAAFSFKLYPCIFGILLLKDHKFAAAGRCTIYAAIFTVLPTFFFEGPGVLIHWLRHVLGINDSAPDVLATNTVTKSTSVPLHWIIALAIVIFLLIQIIKPLLKLQHSQYLFLITYLSLLLCGSQESYNLIIFIIPFLVFLNEERELSRYNIVEFLVYLAALLPAGINQISYPVFVLFLIGSLCRIYHKSKSKTD